MTLGASMTKPSGSIFVALSKNVPSSLDGAGVGGKTKRERAKATPLIGFVPSDVTKVLKLIRDTGNGNLGDRAALNDV